jgi:hypothetical protein
MTTIFGSNVADTTLSTACKMSTTTGGTETSNTTTIAATANPYAEIRSKGGASTAVASLPTPTGNGWIYFPGVAGTFALGNWSAKHTHSAVSHGVNSVIRFYKYSSGTYTSIGTITGPTQTLTAKTTYTHAATSMASVTLTATEGIYVDLWWFDNNANAGGDNPTNFISNSGTTGVASDMEVTTSTFTPTGGTSTQLLQVRARITTLVTKVLQVRAKIRTQVTKTLQVRAIVTSANTSTRVLQVRARIRTLFTRTLQVRAIVATGAQKLLQVRAIVRTQVTKTLQVRAVIRTLATRTLQVRARVSTLRSRTLQTRAILRTQVTKLLQVRVIISTLRTRTLQVRAKILTQSTKTLQVRAIVASPGIVNGGFALFANGTGTAQYDTFRVTEYPDPALSLSPIVPRIGATVASWNALLPAGTSLGVDLSYDGVNWTNVTSSVGSSFPSLYSQPDPFIDGFDTDTHVNYNSTSRAGGGTGTWTYDTAYSRIVATGGTNAVFSYTAINKLDVDFFVDMDRSDAGGVVWRFADPNNFYYLAIGDSLASVGTKNTLTLYRVASNVQTTLGSVGITFTRGTFRRFRVSMLGGIITIYVDGNQALTSTDGSPLGTGTIGLFNNGGTTGSRYYQLWIQPQGDYVTGTPAGDTVTGKFVYTRLRLATTDPTVTPQVQDVTTTALTPQIGAGVTIPSITYASAFLNSNFDDLAKQSNYSWYIGPDKAFVFRSSATVACPWIIQSAPAGLVTNVDLEVDDTLELDVGNDLYRNRQIVIGAQDTLTTSSLFIGDGSSTSFTLGYPLASQPTIILNGVVQTVGFKGLTGFQWYYAIGDPVIEQDSSGTILKDTDQLSVPNYVGLFDVVVTVDDVVEQAARAAIEGGTGIVENVEDRTGQGLTKAAATTLANQLLSRYAIAGRTLIFNTSTNGIQLGSMLSIFLPEHGIWDGQFLVTQLEVTLQKGVNDTQIWWWKVTCSELPRQASWAKLIASGLGLQ